MGKIIDYLALLSNDCIVDIYIDDVFCCSVIAGNLFDGIISNSAKGNDTFSELAFAKIKNVKFNIDKGCVEVYFCQGD